MRYDRRYTLVRVHDNGRCEPLEVVHHPALGLFHTEIVDQDIVVTYQIPAEPLFPPTPEQKTALKVPLDPDPAMLKNGTIEVELYKSKCQGYRMPEEYNSWFSSCLGFETVLAHIGDAKRPVLGTMSPFTRSLQNRGWLSSMASYLTGYGAQDPHYLTFTSVAAYHITTEASLNEVSSRLPEGAAMDGRKFRPNIVLDGEGPYDEEFWGEIAVGTGGPHFALTGNCGRCISINVDYETGKRNTAPGGNVREKLMKDRRVDKGNKWSPVFGRYGWLAEESSEIEVGDEVTVTKRTEERAVWDWPRWK